MDWDEMFLRMTLIVAERSKDPSTQIGAVAVSPDRTRIVIGYNGMITGYPEDDALWERPTKYDHVVHGEENVIINAKTDMTGWTLYLNAASCSKCARLVAQAGIKRVVYMDRKLHGDHKTDLAEEIYGRAGVAIERKCCVELPRLEGS